MAVVFTVLAYNPITRKLVKEFEYDKYDIQELRKTLRVPQNEEMAGVYYVDNEVQEYLYQKYGTQFNPHLHHECLLIENTNKPTKITTLPGKLNDSGFFVSLKSLPAFPDAESVPSFI